MKLNSSITLLLFTLFCFSSVSSKAQVSDRTVEYPDRLINVKQEMWNNSTNVWTPFFYGTFTRNTQNDIILGNYQIWNGSTWQDYQRFNAVFDNNHNKLSMVFSVFINNVWTNDSRSTYTYIPNTNNANYGLSERYNTTTNLWRNENRNYYFYSNSRIERV
jgi:hypothetical protein